MGRKLQLPNEPLKIGERIQKARLHLKLTLDGLAYLTGVNKGQISRFCAGDFKTWSTNLQKVCAELQINEILPGENEPSDLAKVLSEVRVGWECAGPRRAAYEHAIVALAKLTRT